jgi:hypothetical protein
VRKKKSVRREEEGERERWYEKREKNIGCYYIGRKV